MLERLRRYFFGRDIFVSYSRKDGDAYAMALVNALMSARPKLSCYLDTYAAPPDAELPSSLQRHLRRAGMLVLVGTKEAVASPNVQKEVALFAPTRRKIIPIDAGGLVDVDWDAEPWMRISGASRLREERSEPSPAVIDAVVRAIDFRRQEQRLRRAVFGALFVVVVSIVVSVFVAERAVALAERQRRIALARRLANASDTLRRRQPMLLTRSILLAAEATRRFRELGMPSIDTDMSLRDSMSLLPRLVASMPRGKTRTRVAVSDGGAHLAIASENVATVWRQDSGARPLHAIRHRKEIRAMAFGAGGRYVATGGDDAVTRISDTTTGRPLFEITHDSPVLEIVFDANGSNVASADVGGTIEIVSLPEGNRLARVQLDSERRRISFDPTGARLTVIDSTGSSPSGTPRQANA